MSSLLPSAFLLFFCFASRQSNVNYEYYLAIYRENNREKRKAVDGEG